IILFLSFVQHIVEKLTAGLLLNRLSRRAAFALLFCTDRVALALGGFDLFFLFLALLRSRRELYDEWRLHVLLNLLVLRHHLPVFRRLGQLRVDDGLVSL